MPNTDVISSGDEKDLYPKDETEHQAWVSRVLEMFTAADSARRPLETRWRRFYKLWRSYVKRSAGDWRSKVFLPHTFYIIASILPRMTASLPKMTVAPIGPEDVDPAKQLEYLLDWCCDRSGLEEQEVYAWLDALIYGTGILKTKVIREDGFRMRQQAMTQPLMVDQQVPVMDPETGMPMMTPDGQPLMDTQTVTLGELPITDPKTGEQQFEMQRESVMLYQGPAAETVDPFNFWVAPEATSMDDARYVIQRYWRSQSYVEKRIKEGVWRRPDHINEGEYGEAIDDPAQERLADVGLGGGRNDATRKAAEILEVWTPDLSITILNRAIILRIAENPYTHGQLPYVRIVDHPVAHEFWGVGEVEIVEGLQDLLNALVNQRIDNVRLLLNAMFIIDEDAVKDLRDLTMRPGGVIRAKDARAVGLDSLVKRLDMGEVTSSSFSEASEAERIMQMISGVNAYTAGGQPIDSMNQTATGASIISDSGNSRFTHKSRFAEITGYRRLARHFGMNMQQFMPAELVLRTQGQQGQYDFQTLTPESIEGGFDFDIEAESTTTTESIRKDQAMSLFQLLAADPMVNHQKLVEDVLTVFGRKDVQSYIAPPPPPVDPTTGMPMDPNAPQDPLAAAMGGGAPPLGPQVRVNVPGIPLGA